MSGDERVARVFARATTPTLAQALRTVEAKPRGDERNRVRAWLIGELERRHPEAAKAVEDAFLAAELDSGATDVDYVGVLLDHLPT